MGIIFYPENHPQFESVAKPVFKTDTDPYALFEKTVFHFFQSLFYLFKKRGLKQRMSYTKSSL